VGKVELHGAAGEAKDSAGREAENLSRIFSIDDTCTREEMIHVQGRK
jgi:hypothetical protein